jgi:hypothetical protein
MLQAVNACRTPGECVDSIRIVENPLPRPPNYKQEKKRREETQKRKKQEEQMRKAERKNKGAPADPV